MKNPMIKKFVVVAIMCVGFFMVSCGKGEEEVEKATTYIQ